MHPSSPWIGTATGHGWADVLSADARALVLEAARWQDRQAADSPHAEVFEAIAEPASAEGQESLAQYFTPPDVALAAAAALPLPCDVLDPSAGKGSLLIAAGVLMAQVHGIRGPDLLRRLHGVEICPETRDALVANLARTLQPWHGLTTPQAEALLGPQMETADFLAWNGRMEGRAVLTNPPYKEAAGRNPWMEFLRKILAARPAAVAAIVPVALSCSARAQGLRDAMTAWPSVLALHHEIRPRPLFPGVEQRITLVALRGDRPAGYETTGFVVHRARQRETLWQAPTVRFPRFRPDAFDKVAPADLDFHAAQQAGPALQEIGAGETPVEVWLRISGRYHLVAQRQAPEEITSKWKRLLLPPAAADLLVAAFADGTALRWWRIFGDGRDFPVKRFLQTWRPHHAA
jgi:predicted RNA methylase